MKVCISFLLAVFPSIFFVYYYYKQDKQSPEPKSLIIKIFLLGIVYTLPVYGLEEFVAHCNAYFEWSPLIFYFFEAFIVAGMCEEYIKLRIVKKYIYQHARFNEVMDGIVYTITASLGFACMENIIYVMNGNLYTALARGLTAVPMHAVCSGMMGYYIGKAKFAKSKQEERFLINKGFWQAVLIHGLYDFLIFVSPMIGSLFSLFIIPLIFWTYIKLKRRIALATIEDQARQNT